MLGCFADQVVQPFGGFGKILQKTDGCARRGAGLWPVCGGFPIGFIQVHQVDITGNVELPGAQLAHANDPEIGPVAIGFERCAVLRIQMPKYFLAGAIQGKLCEGCHAGGYFLQGGLAIAIKQDQAFEHELAQDAQGCPGVVALLVQGGKNSTHGSVVRQSWRQQVQEVFVAPMQTLHQAAVQGFFGGGRDACRRVCSRLG